MPCRDYTQDDLDRSNEASERRKRLDAATNAACAALTVLTELGKMKPNRYIEQLPRAVQAWWANHQAEDKARIAAEKKRRIEQRREKRIERTTNALHSLDDESLKQLEETLTAAKRKRKKEA